MATLKEKFGKFELGKEQVKSVKGGGYTCIAFVKRSGTATITQSFQTLKEANDFCAQVGNSCTCNSDGPTSVERIGGE
jgi:hypothetical protein